MYTPFFVMSQIVKFQEGGEVEKKFFNYPAGQIEQDKLFGAINKNLDRYIEYQDWSPKKQMRFKNSVDKFITGIKNGNIQSMSEVGKFVDSRGENGGVSDETGNRRFREDKEAASFIRWVLNAQPPYQKEEEKPDTPFNIDNLFAKEFNKEVFKISNDTLDNNKLFGVSSLYKSKNAARKLIFKVLKNVDSKDWGVFGSKENYLNAVNEVMNETDALSKSGKLTTGDFKAHLLRLGLNGDFFNYLKGLDPNQAAPSQAAAAEKPS